MGWAGVCKHDFEVKSNHFKDKGQRTKWYALKIVCVCYFWITHHSSLLLQISTMFLNGKVHSFKVESEKVKMTQHYTDYNIRLMCMKIWSSYLVQFLSNDPNNCVNVKIIVSNSNVKITLQHSFHVGKIDLTWKYESVGIYGFQAELWGWQDCQS